MLGFPWFVSGEVVHGDKRGRELGYPTANLRLDPTCGLRHGIYAVRVDVGGRRHDGVANFGRRPMFDVGTVLLEVFLFDFSGDLYGQTIDVAFIDWIRPELKFDSVDELVRRMDEDSRIARAALAKAPGAFPPLPILASSSLRPRPRRPRPADRETIPSPSRRRESRRPPAAQCGAARWCDRPESRTPIIEGRATATGCAPRARAWHCSRCGVAPSRRSARKDRKQQERHGQISAAVNGL